MNNRVKELANQAAGGMLSYDAEGDWRLSQTEVERFAELIIQECINKIETYRIPVGNSPAGELACDWTYDALKEIRDDIKENFGVE
jgi:hypothetical protein